MSLFLLLILNYSNILILLLNELLEAKRINDENIRIMVVLMMLPQKSLTKYMIKSYKLHQIMMNLKDFINKMYFAIQHMKLV